MRKVYLALSIMAIFAVVLSTTKVNAAYNNSFTVNVDPYFLGWSYLPGVDPVYGEPIYKDLNSYSLHRVTAGDVRVTPAPDGMGGFYAAGTTVVAGDIDINTPLKYTVAQWTVKHLDTGPTANQYDFGEFIYKDADASNSVTEGDTRYSNVPGYQVNSVVVDGDADVGGSLVTFMGTTAGAYESYTDNVAANNMYDFAILSVDILWSSDIPDNSPDGMRGWQLYCAVDATVLTPYGWVGAQPGYVLSDFLTTYGIPLTTAMVGAVTPNKLDVSEQILGAVTGGAGDMWTGAKLVTLEFIPQSQTGLSILDLLDTSLGYQDAATETWHTVTLVDGGYNFVVPEFPTGIGVLIAMIALIPVIYVWRTRKKNAA